LLHLFEGSDVLIARDSAQQRKYAIQNTALGRGSNNQAIETMNLPLSEYETIKSAYEFDREKNTLEHSADDPPVGDVFGTPASAWSRLFIVGAPLHKASGAMLKDGPQSMRSFKIIRGRLDPAEASRPEYGFLPAAQRQRALLARPGNPFKIPLPGGVFCHLPEKHWAL